MRPPRLRSGLVGKTPLNERLPMHNDLDDYLDDAPQHGFRGDSATTPAVRVPAALTVAVSREAGARGGTIGRRAGRKLGWQVYDQELLEYLSQDSTACQNMIDSLRPDAAAWV